MKILLIEDEQFLSELLKEALTSHHYTVDWATDGEMGVEFASSQSYDLVILDIQLPKLDGLSVCRKLRSQGFTSPILILTTLGSSQDISVGLDAGADDYLTKPFNTTELLARIRALLRRGKVEAIAPVLTWGKLTLDPSSAQVMYEQKILALRPKEYTLLELFLRYPQRIFSRDAIIDRLWTIDDTPTTHAVTNLIKDLRNRLNTAGMAEELIETVYGIGYRVHPEPKIELGNQNGSEGKKPEESQIKLDEKLPKELLMEPAPLGIAEIQHRFQRSLEQRVNVLRTAERSLQAGKLTSEQQVIAKAEAHRLAGSLGTFGYPHGSDLAKLIENLLLESTTPEKLKALRMHQLLLELDRELSKPPVARILNPTAEPLVLFVGEDLNLADALYLEAVERKFQFELVESAKIFDLLIEQTSVVVVMAMDQPTATDQSNRLALLQRLKQRFPNTPVLSLGCDHAIASVIDLAQASLEQRIQVARMGGDRYLPAPSNLKEIFDAIAQLLPQPPKSEAKVMIVDHDPKILATLETSLNPWGMQVTCLSYAIQFWNVLTTTKPDLLLLDLEMPTFNGIDLCLAIRQEPQYDDLAIIMTTAQSDRTLMQQAFAAGADDLVSKPLQEPELISLILTRIEKMRSRQQQSYEWQQQKEIDPLTQIVNRRAFNKYLKQLMQNSPLEKSLSLILCGMDEFKLYNTHYGHPAGDVCLQQIASAIGQCIKIPSDRLARFGRDEFAIILPNTSQNAAVSVAERIQNAIADVQIPHVNTATYPYVTLSMGIASASAEQVKSCDQLIADADQALCEAKNQGRNTYCLS
jgi:diguanylate cyclase (GGDEF)-like protein